MSETFYVGDRVNVITLNNEAIILEIDNGIITIEFPTGLVIDVQESDLEYLGPF